MIQIAASRDKNHLELRNLVSRQKTDVYLRAAALTVDGDVSYCCGKYIHHGLKVVHPLGHDCFVDIVIWIGRERAVCWDRP